jgi:hypothetical protein
MSKRQEEEGRVPAVACQVEEGVGEGPDWQKRAAGGWHQPTSGGRSGATTWSAQDRGEKGLIDGSHGKGV